MKRRISLLLSLLLALQCFFLCIPRAASAEEPPEPSAAALPDTEQPAPPLPTEPTDAADAADAAAASEAPDAPAAASDPSEPAEPADTTEPAEPTEPSDPAPEEPAPDDPTPDEPTPDDPTPDDPTPDDPTPDDPDPDDPDPDDPEPDNPDPDDPVDPDPDNPVDPEPDPGFDDIAGHWAENAILRAKALGLMSGVSETSFSPRATMTRAMFVVVLCRLDEKTGEHAAPTPASFSDVPRDAWYTEAVDWAAENGIVGGVGDNRFAPKSNCTREQAVTILCAYMRYVGRPLNETADLSGYADLERISVYARFALRWAVGAGLISGTAADCLSPRNNMTRAQLAVIVCAVYDYLNGDKPLPPQPPAPAPLEQSSTAVFFSSGEKSLPTYTADGARYLSLNAFSAAIGGSLQVGGEPGCREATLRTDNRSALFSEGFPLITLNGTTRLSAPVRAEADGWYIPLDAAALWFGVDVCEDPRLDRIWLWGLWSTDETVWYNTARFSTVHYCGAYFCLNLGELAALAGGVTGQTETQDGVRTAEFTLCGHKLRVFENSGEILLDGSSVVLKAPVLLKNGGWWIPESLLWTGLGLTRWKNSARPAHGFVRHTAGSTAVWIEGKKLPASYLACGTKYVSLSDCAAVPGASFTAGGNTASLSLFGHSLTLREGFSQQLDGKTLSLSTPVYRTNGTWFMPLAETVPKLGLTELRDPSLNQLYYTRIVRHADIPTGYQVPVLMYHAVSDNIWGIEELFVSPANMEAQLKALLQAGRTPITFEDLDHVDKIRKPVMLTFDDGYKDNYTELFPLLKKYNVKVTIFMITGAVGNQRSLTKAQIQEMQASGLVSFQSHTVDHLDMDTLTEAELEYQTRQSQLDLARITGKQSFVLCYPTGKNNALSRQITAKYYEFGLCMSGARYVTGTTNPYLIYRYYISRYTSIGTFKYYIS